MAFLTTMSLVALIGCRDPVTWAADSHSPDGMWIATAQTIEHRGFGTGGVETTVEIKRSNVKGSPERVLAFAEGGPEIDLKMRWDGPAHLVVLYNANPVVLYFQVVKTSGLDISAQNFSANPAAGV